MNCPECGRFMRLEIAFEIGKNVWAAAYWWICADDGQHVHQVEPVPAPAYDWLWGCEGIPAEVLLSWPELRREYDDKWNRLPASVRRRYRHALVP